MSTDRTTLVIPLLLIILGTGWLLTAMGAMPNVDWA